MHKRTLGGWGVLSLFALGAAMAATGCGGLRFGTGGGSTRVVSAQTGDFLGAEFPTRVYATTDPNGADLYMTDLPPEVWTSGADVSDAEGVIVHVHMFVRSRAGGTPLDVDASNCTIRVLVLARGHIGIYGGGGFLWRSGDPGDRTFGGSVSEATVRLTRATPGFDDRLGPSAFNGSFSCQRDDEQARALGRAFSALASYGTLIEVEPELEAGPEAAEDAGEPADPGASDANANPRQ